eukprot:7273638-Prymnesium_polylepis.1
MGHSSLDFRGLWLESSGEGMATWTHVLSHRGEKRNRKTTRERSHSEVRLSPRAGGIHSNTHIV